MFKKLLSRKLWIALGAAITAVATGNPQEAAAIVIGYLIGQGIADSKTPEAK